MYRSQPILVVEDDADEALLIQRSLAGSGVANSIITVRSGEEAIQYLNGEGPFEDRLAHALPCLMLLDLRIQGMQGLDLLRWIRSNPRCHRLPVVVLTHCGEQAVIDRAYDLGANSFLIKPPDLESLRKLLKTINGYWMVLAQKPEL